MVTSNQFFFFLVHITASQHKTKITKLKQQHKQIENLGKKCRYFSVMEVKKTRIYILIDISFKGAQKVILLVIYSLNQSDNFILLNIRISIILKKSVSVGPYFKPQLWTPCVFLGIAS